MIVADPYALFRHFFCRVFCPCTHKHSHRLRAKVTLAAGSISMTCIPEGTIMFSLPDDTTASAAVAYVDAKGKTAKVDGAPVWSSSDPAIFDVVAAADGLSAVVTPMDIGAAQLKVEADADLGAGVVSVVTLVDIEVLAGQAVAGNVTLTLGGATTPPVGPT